MPYNTIIFDFDGVLCRDRFYEKALVPQYQNVYDWLQTNIFTDKELVRRWMRNQIDSNHINRIISQNTGIDFEKLDNLFDESVKKMQLDIGLLELACQLKDAGKKIAIVTDNMDVFSQITVANHRLNELFDIIINSADYGMLKKDKDGQLFDFALAALRTEIRDSLLIDDSVSTVELYKQKGGQGHCFENLDKLRLFLDSIT